MDYVVTKLPRFPFDKFADASNRLSTQMKATGEVMSVGRTIEESLLKGIRSLEIGVCHLHMKKFDNVATEELYRYIQEGTDDRIYAIGELLRRGADTETISQLTRIDLLFVEKLRHIVQLERELAAAPFDREALLLAKQYGFCDQAVAGLWQTTEDEVWAMRQREGILPDYKMIDTCASEFQS